MNKKELEKALSLAYDSSVDLMNESMGHMDGYGLPGFKPVVVTLRQVARLIRWQAQLGDGSWDWDEINDIERHGRTRFVILDPDAKYCEKHLGQKMKEQRRPDGRTYLYCPKCRRNREATIRNTILRDLTGTSARAARQDMGM